jgi:hypothetical protein
MTLIILGLVVALIAIVYLVKAPAPGGAGPGCAGILLGAMIVLGAIVKIIFF